MSGEWWWLYGIGAFLLAYALLAVVVFWAMAADVAEINKARRAGCRCSSGALVKFIRDDCPYHHRKKEQSPR